MIRARIRIRVTSRAMAESIVQSIEPDNIGMGGLKIEPRISAENAYFTITHSGKIETFISTLDDVLRCIQAARSTLHGIVKDKRS
ncbi:MAG TPA: KEOPS complex subunit Pcc1 [Candidatus Bathyarchaeia archaeon]|nr:KEOPS complex subunit Pcc1 [Candidatus Bathyarchaeia archaeon]